MNFKRTAIVVLLATLIFWLYPTTKQKNTSITLAQPSISLKAFTPTPLDASEKNASVEITKREFGIQHEAKTLEEVKAAGAKYLKTFYKLRSKALLDDSEKRQYQDLLQNTKNLRHSFVTLTSPLKGKFSEMNKYDRIAATSFLREAVTWQDNPKRESILNDISDILAMDYLSNIENLQERKSFAGDKVELYLTLLREAPDKAARLKKRAQGTRLARIIQFTEDSFKTQKL